MARLRDCHLTVNDAVNMVEQRKHRSATIYMCPPVNANDDLTDEDSANEEEGDVNTLSANQLLAEAELASSDEEVSNKLFYIDL